MVRIRQMGEPRWCCRDDGSCDGVGVERKCAGLFVPYQTTDRQRLAMLWEVQHTKPV